MQTLSRAPLWLPWPQALLCETGTLGSQEGVEGASRGDRVTGFGGWGKAEPCLQGSVT